MEKGTKKGENTPKVHFFAKKLYFCAGFIFPILDPKHILRPQGSNPTKPNESSGISGVILLKKLKLLFPYLLRNSNIGDI